MSIQITPISLTTVVVTTINESGSPSVTLRIDKQDADPEHRLLAYRLAAAYFGNQPEPTADYITAWHEENEVTRPERWITTDVHEDTPADAVFGPDTWGLVDEREGGVVAYFHKGNAWMFMPLLAGESQ